MDKLYEAITPLKDGLFGHVRPVLKSSFQGLSDARKIWGGFH